MAVKIYTKTGDDGTTGLFGGGRVRKDADRIDAYGDVDELNSAIGLARSYSMPADADRRLADVQNALFVLGADLATPIRQGEEHRFTMRVTSEDVACLERAIDEMEGKLPPLEHFILPGGTSAGAALHLARTICRRAERRVARLMLSEPVGELPLQYLNRLSDMLFVLARTVNSASDVPEERWAPRKDRSADDDRPTDAD